jgi:hypothetical protein
MSAPDTASRLIDAQLRHIFVEVSLGRGRHGDFLKSFAQAVLRADPDNFALIRPAATMLVVKYMLRDYLDNFTEEKA